MNKEHTSVLLRVLKQLNIKQTILLGSVCGGGITIDRVVINAKKKYMIGLWY